MKALIGGLVALALAVSISACGANGVDPCASPTAPGCNTGGGGVPASTVASVTGIKMKLGSDSFGQGGEVIQPASVTEADGVKTYNFILPREDWMSFEVTVFNPRAEGREVRWEIANSELDSRSSRRFDEPFTPNPDVKTTGSLIRPDQVKGGVVTYILSGEETGGNLAKATPLKAVVVVSKGW